MELINNVAKESGGYSFFAGVGERTRKVTTYMEMKESGVLANTGLVFGQMNEPQVQNEVALTGLTQTGIFEIKEGQDVLLFVDNIFRFTQAGSEVSALLGRIPSAVGYQPTLATDLGALQEGLLQPLRALLLLSKQFMFLLMILQTLLQQQLLLI